MSIKSKHIKIIRRDKVAEIIIPIIEDRSNLSAIFLINNLTFLCIVINGIEIIRKITNKIKNTIPITNP